MGKEWQVLEPDPDQIDQLSKTCKIDPLLAKCLLNRNIPEYQEVEEFLHPCAYEPPDPFLVPDMHKAVARIERALANGERICIYGDYDADGVTAIAILTRALKELGGDVFYYIPDRFFEGVGLHCERLRQLKDEENVSLVITVDTGTRAFEEMDFANEMALDVIITDHHTPDKESPKALAVLNPKAEGSEYPFTELSGAGVAFKLVQALDHRFPGTLLLGDYLKIAAIGTIADMVPLREENRWIVARGLREINREDQGPIRCLLRKLGVRGFANALDISFKVAPRINAPGRLGDPDTAIAFFRCQSSRDINRIVDTMDGMNSVRQMLERDLEAKINLQLRHAYRKCLPPFILVAGRHWHRGILGIMACKILRRYRRPACVLSFDDHEAHGSIRGTSGLNILEPMHHIASLLNSFGGHPEAAGVSLPVTNVPQFRDRMNELLAAQSLASGHQSISYVDAVVDWRDLDKKLFTIISKLEPFGIGNHMPAFMTANLILESEPVRRGPWFHFEASDGQVARKCSFYHPSELSEQFERFDSVDLVYSLTPFRDEYQVQIIEMRPSEG
ncbi:single-stranded-DNA-specific exonuclease RecJ [Sulfidibacter corallicola]|uniref:Single-stranded-DNA-specific exonuclease RecJ n=1 Tax=Sulfidibacter corallicola TaxID=2818388 RepID=A0A8A4TT41_SULCO|nr:single-stranded-DNA-specific exonuclease RecJ [Sulfidibacter corallicola]QTD52700.1 single-stranded-DNA-specific exonuclease RecJ [Sulfidibacter corallicola]